MVDEIVGGPTPIQVPRGGDMYRWKVLHGRAEQHVYVQIAGSLSPEAFEEPLRSAIESKGESVLLTLLAGQTSARKLGHRQPWSTPNQTIR